jgi:hypothetical protein
MVLQPGTKRRVSELLRAMLGSVSWNLRAVWLDEIGPTSVILRFLLALDNEEDREEIDDIAFEFEALQDTGIDLDVQVYVSNDSLSTFHDFGYLVYARWEDN